MGTFEGELARCDREHDAIPNLYPGRVIQNLGGQLDWLIEKIYIERERMQKFVTDAKRTEPDYTAALQRLQDVRTVRLLHVAMGLATEAGEFVDTLKAAIFYGRPIDRVNLIEELGDSSWYERIGCDVLEVELTEMLQRNVDKLRARFPNKFTEDNANNRDLDKERKILEADSGQ